MKRNFLKITAIILGFIGLIISGFGTAMTEVSKAIFFKINQGKTS